MGKLLWQTTAEYLAECRRNYQWWLTYSEDFQQIFDRHKAQQYNFDTGEPLDHNNCETCVLFEQCTEANREFTEHDRQTLANARKGIYD